MGKKMSNIGLVLVFLVGLIILIYPKVSSYYNGLVSSYNIGKYEDEIKKTEKKDLSKIFERAEKYNKGLLEKGSTIKTGESKDENYLSQLKIKEDEQIIGTITIDKINVRLPIYHGTSEPVLQSGVGHLEGTTLPIGGVGMHSVLTGHTGLPSAKLFSDLEKLIVGDTFVVKILDRTLTYKISKIDVVLPKEVQNIKPVKGKDMLTLITCTPYGVNSHRLLVHGERIENEKIEEEVNLLGENKRLLKKDTIVICIVVIIVIAVIYLIIRKRNKNLGE
ncbi:MAG: class C sortase [Clostridium sp.]|uniref:class C sortase n=1 Tax=Clostridium sp. TaxID=1506 RepID=UPI003EE5D288